MEKTSLWRSKAEKSDFSSLTGDLVSDVVIIGGGITGVTAGHLLGKSGLQVTVLEAMHIGGGTTGFSTGNLYCTVDEYLHKIQSKYGTESLKKVISSRSLAVDFIRDCINEFTIDCELITTPFYFFAESEDGVKKVEKEADAAKEAGLKVSLETEIDLPFKIARAMKLEGQAQFNPMKYIKQLSKAVHGRYCTIYEETKVLNYTENKGTYTVTTENGSVKAKHIILATHTPKGILGIQTLLYPYREYAVAYKYEGSMIPGIFWGIDHENKHSIRHYQSGEEKFLLVLGEKHKTGQEKHNLENIENLKSYAASHFALTGEPAFQWGAQHYRSSDGLPSIGRADTDGNLYFACGYSTDGLVYGTLAALILTDMINDKQNPFEELYSPQRHHPLQSAPSFIKENLNVLGQYFKDVPFTADVKNQDEVKPGEGKIIEHDNEKLAVYRDENNKLHVCSAVCTHMECIVTWNEAETSWDCPCHGSRFTYEGKVIEGPAIADLPKKEIN
jgi:glycine/D-amino acid oxidase-like deaminating enzyme/nitrite reductase/ring-hydroxylating ferredoxin subunit